MNSNEKTFADLLLNSDDDNLSNNNVNDDSNKSNSTSEVSFSDLNNKETSNIFSVASEDVLTEKNNDDNLNFSNIFEVANDEVNANIQNVGDTKNNDAFNNIDSSFSLNDINKMVDLDNRENAVIYENQELNDNQVNESNVEEVNVEKDNENENIFNTVVNDNLFVADNINEDVDSNLEKESSGEDIEIVDNIFVNDADKNEEMVDNISDVDIDENKDNNDISSNNDIELNSKVVVDNSDFDILKDSNDVSSNEMNDVVVDDKVDDQISVEVEDNTTNIFMDVSEKENEDVSFGKQDEVTGNVINPFVNQTVDNVVDDVKVNEKIVNDPNKDFVIESPLFSNEVINLVEDETVTTNVPKKIELDKTKNFEVKVVKKKDPLIKFIIGVISYAFFIWLLLIGVTLLVYVLDIKIRASKGDYSTPTFNAYVVLTGSMLPEIQVNDVVITKKVEPEKLDVGDIITFASTDSRFAGTIITHRIIKKNPAVDGGQITFQTKGDNNNVADSALVVGSNVYGKVILKIPKLGYLQEFLATDGGWIIVILIPCLTVISYDIVKIVKGLKRKKYDNIKVKK